MENNKKEYEKERKNMKAITKFSTNDINPNFRCFKTASMNEIKTAYKRKAKYTTKDRPNGNKNNFN